MFPHDSVETCSSVVIYKLTVIVLLLFYKIIKKGFPFYSVKVFVLLKHLFLTNNLFTTRERFLFFYNLIVAQLV